MEIYFFRHGIAEDRSPDGTDAARELTQEGLQKTEQAAQGFAQLIDAPDAVYTSPKRRAVQTAQIVAGQFGLKPQLMPALAEASPRILVDRLRQLRESRVVLVGHEPTLSLAVQLLTTHQDASPFLELKKAGCAALEFDPTGQSIPAHARLLWLATPKILRALAKPD